MRLHITADGIELSPSLNTYIEQQIGGLEHYLGSADSSAVTAQVEVGKASHHHRHSNDMFVRVNLHIGGKNLRAGLRPRICGHP